MTLCCDATLIKKCEKRANIARIFWKKSHKSVYLHPNYTHNRMKDLIFAIYRYHITRMATEVGELFPEGRKFSPKDYDTAELFFESFFPARGGKMDIREEIRKTRKNKHEVVETVEKDPHNNKVMEHRDNVIILALQANGSKKIYDADWSDHPEPNHQPCLMVIDNREGHQFVAIERVAMDTDKSAQILESSMNYLMNPYGYRFQVKRLKRDLPFLEAVYDIKDTLGDNINRVVFDFDKHLSNRQKLGSRFLKSLDEWLGRFADSGQIAANITDDELLKDAVIRQDLALMAELCLTNPHYNLLVKYEHFGLFRFGQDVRAQYGVDAVVVEDFVNPRMEERVKDELFPMEETEPAITLTEWLDKVQTLYMKYEEEPLSAKRRKRRRRL